MGILSWNCQGVRNPWTIRHLKEMRRSHFPDILFLMETKNSDDFIVQIHGWLGYDNFRIVEPEGLSGGLAIFWKNILDIEILYADKNL
ncbi:endonuclease/exonuclease/phosphatase family protein, partial [Mycobacterium tuberculosis]